jgi:chromosome segregation ATPase
MEKEGCETCHAPVEELQAHIAEVEKERDHFCAMVVELETKLLSMGPGSSEPRRADMDDEGRLRERIAELERQNQTLDADRGAVDAECAACRQQAEQQRLRASAAEEAWKREREELRERQEETARELVLACEDKATALAQKSAELVHVQEELAVAMTQGQALSRDIDEVRRELEQVASEKEAVLELKKESNAALSREKVGGVRVRCAHSTS